MKQAKVVDVGRPHVGQHEREMQLRAGAKGKGRIISSTIYWPGSPRSCEAADDYIAQAAKRNGYEIVAEDF